jgi:hypothetical protein
VTGLFNIPDVTADDPLHRHPRFSSEVHMKSRVGAFGPNDQRPERTVNSVSGVACGCA